MGDLQIINGVECYEKDGVAYLKLEPVARGLGFTQTKNGVEYVKWERVAVYLSEFGFSPQVGKDGFIPENIFYRLAMKAKNEVAEAFQAKIADEVIPAIRKHGGYLTETKVEEALLNPDVLIRLATDLKEEREKRKALEGQITEDRPKVLFAESVSTAKTSILVSELAKLIRQNGVEMGQRRLFEWLRQNGYLMKSGSSYNMPTQKAMEQGLFEIKETVINNPDGSTRLTRTPKVTGKGQIYFVNRMLNQ